MNGNIESFETLIKNSFKYPIYEMSKFWTCTFYRDNFYKNNRWNKTATLKFYSELPENFRHDFKNLFIQNFELNKTNNEFLKIINEFDERDIVKLDKQDLKYIIDELIELKKGKTIEIKRNNKTITENRKLNISYKSLAEGLVKGFATGYSKSYIEDLLKEKSNLA